MDDNSLMPFGKHKGTKLANVPGSYLVWLYENGDVLKYERFKDLRDYIRDNLDALNTENE